MLITIIKMSVFIKIFISIINDFKGVIFNEKEVDYIRHGITYSGRIRSIFSSFLFISKVFL